MCNSPQMFCCFHLLYLHDNKHILIIKPHPFDLFYAADSPCFTLCRICLVDLNGSAPSIREALSQLVGTNATTLLQGSHCALRLSKCHVLCPGTKTPTSISSQLALNQTKISLCICHFLLRPQREE